MAYAISPDVLQYILEKWLGNYDDLITASHVCKDWRMIVSRISMMHDKKMPINFPDIMCSGVRNIAFATMISGSVN